MESEVWIVWWVNLAFIYIHISQKIARSKIAFRNATGGSPDTLSTRREGQSPTDTQAARLNSKQGPHG